MQTGHSYIPQGRIRSYRFGFNGMEKINEQYGEGNAYDFGERILDVRLGRWMSRDPLAMQYPDLSPYVYSANSPIFLVDVGGKFFRVYYKVKDEESGTVVTRHVDFNGTQAINDDGSTYAMGTNQFVDNVLTSYEYIVSNGADVDNVMQKVASSTIQVDVRYTKKRGATLYDDKLLLWDSRKGLKVGKRGKQSPALGFYHEVYHAYLELLAPVQLQTDLAISDKADDNVRNYSSEEEYVTEKESMAAEILSVGRTDRDEGRRADYYDHRGEFKAQGTTTTQNVDKGTLKTNRYNKPDVTIRNASGRDPKKP